MKTPLSRLPLSIQFTSLLLLFIGIVGIAAHVIGQSVVVSQTVNESRSIADMTEHIGRWASQYGGVHIKKDGDDTNGLGYALKKYSYAASATDVTALFAPDDKRPNIVGQKVNSVAEEIAALNRIETYHWKNPALIQREISDIAAASTSKAKFRITAKSVLNPGNKATDFENRAISAIEKKLDEVGRPAAEVEAKSKEYWEVQAGHLYYARVLIAQKSCLTCHGDSRKAPDFLKLNSKFNGGGGFGYVEGRPAGVISVSIPLPAVSDAMASSMTDEGWYAVTAIGLSGFALLFFVGRRVIKPVNDLRDYAAALASPTLGQTAEAPEMIRDHGPSSNEVHRLGSSIHELGQALKVMQKKLHEAKSLPADRHEG